MTCSGSKSSTEPSTIMARSTLTYAGRPPVTSLSPIPSRESTMTRGPMASGSPLAAAAASVPR